MAIMQKRTFREDPLQGGIKVTTICEYSIPLSAILQMSANFKTIPAEIGENPRNL
jgi:hypothetical protein